MEGTITVTTEELTGAFLQTLKRRSGRFVIKDFIGFLNWDPTLGAALLPYTGHHAPFCTAVKQNAEAYRICIACSACHRRLCRKGEPFSKPCYFGLQEYTAPIVAGSAVAGSVSSGIFCPDPERSLVRIKHAAVRFAMDENRLREVFFSLADSERPEKEAEALIRFTAEFLADAILPYAACVPRRGENAGEKEGGLNAIRTYIVNHYADPNISVSAIAKNCHYSVSYVSHTFGQGMQVNVRTYINQLRIVLAKHELAAGNSVTDAAAVCGFNDTNYFSSVFRASVGVPPSRWAEHELGQRVHMPVGRRTRAESSYAGGAVN